MSRSFLESLLEIRPREATSGCALGCDSIGIELAEEIGVPLLRLTLARVRSTTEPGYSVLVGNRPLLKRAEKGQDEDRWTIEYGPVGWNAGDGFLRRDDVTVAHSEILLAAPKTSIEEFRGSGTWATIRRARKKGIKIRCFPLDESTPWTEPEREGLF